DGDSIGGSGGKGIRGGGEVQGDNGDAGGEYIASSLTISESDQAGIGSSSSSSSGCTSISDSGTYSGD
nr:hypothetical protein [Tanacetum cinerariifolium]